MKQPGNKDDRTVTRGRTNTSRRGALAIALGLLLVGTAGCSDKSNVTLHEPGVYKGDPDPLLTLQSDPEYAAALRERFVKGQSDR